MVSACLEGALDFLNLVGLENIQKKNQLVRDHFLKSFPKNKYQLVTPSEFMGNIVCVRSLGEDSIKLEHELKSRNIDVSVRQGNIRISFHVFNTNNHADQLVEALDH